MSLWKKTIKKKKIAILPPPPPPHPRGGHHAHKQIHLSPPYPNLPRPSVLSHHTRCRAFHGAHFPSQNATPRPLVSPHLLTIGLGINSYIAAMTIFPTPLSSSEISPVFFSFFLSFACIDLIGCWVVSFVRISSPRTPSPVFSPLWHPSMGGIPLNARTHARARAHRIVSYRTRGIILTSSDFAPPLFPPPLPFSLSPFLLFFLAPLCRKKNIILSSPSNTLRYVAQEAQV